MLNLSCLANVLDLNLPDIAVQDLQLDSRLVQANDVFVAIAGEQLDGRRFIKQAIANGAVAVLAESEQNQSSIEQMDGALVIHVPMLRNLQADIALAFYSKPRNSQLIGITGTNGKTSVADIIYQLTQQAGLRSAYIGTLGIKATIDDKLIEQPLANTTPVAIELQQHLSKLADADCIAMEVSSHALAQERVKGCEFGVVVFTNLSHDHLDFHNNMADYFAAKAKLFTDYHYRSAVLNFDSQAIELKDKVASDKIVAFGRNSAVKQCERFLHLSHCQPQPHGFKLSLDSHLGSFELTLPLLAEFNVENVLAAFSACLAYGVSLSQLISFTPLLRPVCGRMELMESAESADVIIDFAHTPDALALSSQSCRHHLTNENSQLWVVFGCGGDRDTSKRALMAQAAEQFADHIVVTSDNPRNESPQAIIDQVMTGFRNAKNILQIADRKIAIKTALARAGNQDLILIAGKGHETYQEINGEKRPYDEREFVKQLTKEIAA